MSRLNQSLLTLLAPALLLNASAADESLDPKAPPLGKYEVKVQSSFRVDESTRPPFWPIGFVKRAATTAQPQAEQVVRTALTPESFAVTSVLLGNPSLAVINGRAYGEGETIRTPKGAAAKGVKPAPGLRVQVAKILDGRVVLQSTDGQSIEVALRRGQLPERKAETDLLLNDEE
jgi:hypothetical protein